jgi:hypothetical protein
MRSLKERLYSNPFIKRIGKLITDGAYDDNLAKLTKELEDLSREFMQKNRYLIVEIDDPEWGDDDVNVHVFDERTNERVSLFVGARYLSVDKRPYLFGFESVFPDFESVYS